VAIDQLEPGFRQPLSTPQLEAAEVDQRLDSDEEIQTQDSLNGKAVVESAHLHLEVPGLQVTDRNPVQPFGEDELDAPDSADAPQAVLGLGYEADRENGVCGDDGGRGTGIEDDVVDDQLPASEGEVNWDVGQAALEPDLHPTRRRPSHSRSSMSSICRSVWST